MFIDLNYWVLGSVLTNNLTTFSVMVIVQGVYIMRFIYLSNT